MTTETLTTEELTKMATEPPPKPKLTRLMELVGSVPKDGTNDFHHYKFSSAKAVLGKVQSALIELGLYSVPTFDIVSQERTEKQLLVTVKCSLGVFDSEGPIAHSVAYGSGADTGDKAIAKAMTMADKYSWLMLLNIPTGDDPESDTSTDARTAPNVSQPASLGVTGAIGHVTNAKVLEVKKKNADNPKSPYTIVTDKGTYDTFDKDIIAQMSLAQASGLITDFAFKETKWGKDIVKEKPNGTAPVTER